MAKVILEFDDMKNGNIKFRVCCDPVLKKNMTIDDLTIAQTFAFKNIELAYKMQKEMNENND